MSVGYITGALLGGTGRPGKGGSISGTRSMARTRYVAPPLRWLQLQWLRVAGQRGPLPLRLQLQLQLQLQ